MLQYLKKFFCILSLFYIGWLGCIPGYAAELSGVIAISAGTLHTCALTTTGGVVCWGSYIKLLNNSFEGSLTPVKVAGLDSGVVAISAGDSHTCALTTAGGVKCWGKNFDGQLGDNSTTNRLTPVGVTGLDSGVAAIAAGGYNTCALTTAGGVMCWGYNGDGAIGDNSTTNRLTPVNVMGLASGVAAITTGGGRGGDVDIDGGDHTCALITVGKVVKCWGNNTFGQLGDNSTTNRLTPVNAFNLGSLFNGAVAISAGAGHTCALTTAGGATCWGSNFWGQVGDNFTTNNRLKPAGVTGLDSGVVAISAGGSHTCTLTTAGGVKCWGRNFYGQLGDNSQTSRFTPVAVIDLAGVSPASPSVIEFYNTNLDNYFITADASEAAAIDGGSAGPGWIRTGNSFKSGGNAAVCRFYGSQSPGPNSHFYTVDPGECASLKQLQASTPATEKRWNFESLDFVSTSPINGACPSGTGPVYRAYNNGFTRGIDSNHRITSSSSAIQEVVSRGWSNEGVVMCAPN